MQRAVYASVCCKQRFGHIVLLAVQTTPAAIFRVKPRITKAASGLVALVAILLASSALLHFSEGIDWLDCAYWCDLQHRVWSLLARVIDHTIHKCCVVWLPSLQVQLVALAASNANMLFSLHLSCDEHVAHTMRQSGSYLAHVHSSVQVIDNSQHSRIW
jgi:hypothetical protein